MIIKDTIRDDIIELAISKLECEYIHGAHGPNEFDCAGLVWYIYNKLLNIDLYENGYGLSTTTKIMTSKYGKITLFEETCQNKEIYKINKGDIIFFHRQSLNENNPTNINKYPGHCGIYLEKGNFIHCPKTKGLVIKNNLYKNNYWYKKTIGYKNIIDYL